MTPPIIGAVIRFIASAPAPWLHMIGSNPKRIAIIVIIFGRMRFTAPSVIASRRSSIFCMRPSLRHFRGLIQVESPAPDHRK